MLIENMDYIKNKRVAIYGFAGSIGEELTRQLAPNNTIYGVDLDETRMFDLVEELGIQGRVGNVEDERTVLEVFEEFKPDLVFMAAARKHVKPSEEKPAEAIKTNIWGTYYIVEACKKYGAKLVNISTDKVVNAGGIMGSTKKVAELMVKNAGFISVRFGNVLGSRGSLIPIWERQMKRGDPLTITHPDMERYFMSIPEACELIIKAAEIGEPGQILIMDMGKPVKIIDVAKKIIEELKYGGGIKEIGIKPGEQMSERLMTEDEYQRAIKIENFFII